MFGARRARPSIVAPRSHHALPHLAHPRERAHPLLAQRHARTAHDLALIARLPGIPMKIAITGASGLVGKRLVPLLGTAGHDVLRFVRRTPRAPDEIAWDPDRGTIDEAALEHVDAVIHLAGENIGDGRWNDQRRRRILESRTRGTALVAQALAARSSRPRVLISASAIGWYGDRGDEPIDESSSRGTGFLADVCDAWEHAADPARAAGIRVVHPRFGVVLAAEGGALARLRTPFSLGLGGPVGDGRQWMSWIHIDDAIGAILHLLTADVSGPVNLTAPEPATSAELASTLGRVLRRPAVLPLPAFAIRLALGDMGERLLLDGARVAPRRLLDSGYAFRFPSLEGALRHELGVDTQAPVAAP